MISVPLNCPAPGAGFCRKTQAALVNGGRVDEAMQRDIRRRRPTGWAEVLLNVERVSQAELEPLFDRVEFDYPVAGARRQSADRTARISPELGSPP